MNEEKCSSCQATMVEREVKKEGKNKGRHFWSCPRCGEGFKWIEKEEPKAEKPNGEVNWDQKDRWQRAMNAYKSAGSVYEGTGNWLSTIALSHLIYQDTTSEMNGLNKDRLKEMAKIMKLAEEKDSEAMLDLLEGKY